MTTMGARPPQGKRLMDDDDNNMWDGQCGLHRTNSPWTTTMMVGEGQQGPLPLDNNENEIFAGQMAHGQ